MTDDLERLKAALRAATPTPDPDAREAAIALAKKNFAARQGTTETTRLMHDGQEKRAGFVTGVMKMFEKLGVRSALYATTSLAVVGLGIVLVLPMEGFRPPTGIPELRKVEEAAPLIEQMVQDDQTSGAVQYEMAEAEPLAVPPPAPVATAKRKSGYQASQAPGGNLVGLTASDRDEGAALRRQDDNERFANEAPNPLKIVSEEPVSTFSIDVDTASYAYVRTAIMGGYLPDADAVRIEEMVNYFPYDYRAPDGDAPFATSVSVFQTPWNAHTRLVHIGIQGEKPATDARPPLDLVFLIDTSGSMQDENKLPLLKQSFRLLLSKLNPDDRVSIVTYAGSSGVVLEPTSADDKSAIYAALDRLEAGGSTAGAEGLRLAYAQAEKMHEGGRLGRILLATDGDFNVGISDPEDLKKYVEKKRESGTYLSVLGFGRGNYNDALMQAIAQNGNGTASYIDTLSEAQKVLVDQVSGALFPIANDVKIQIEFNPAQIAEYRLIGYETRALNREDFNNDKVDAGDIGAGHNVTAIYEITPVGSPAIKSDPLRYQDSPETASVSQELAFLKLRYKVPGEDVSHLLTTPISGSEVTLSPDAAFGSAIAGFGQLLRDAKYMGDWSWQDAIALANANKGDDPFGYRAEAVKLMRLAETLASQ